MLITYKEISLIHEEYKNYINSLNLKDGTREQYIDIIRDYLINEVMNKVEYGNYSDFFTLDKTIHFQKNFRRSMVVRAAIKNLKDYFISINKLEKYFNFEYEPIKQEGKSDKKIILQSDIISIVFGERTYFRDIKEKYLTQCICALCYFCLFEQRHILALKKSDVLVDEKRIRNIRVDDHEQLVQWIALGEIPLKCIKAYIEYFEIENMSSDNSFFDVQTETKFNMSYINKLFNNFDLKVNKEKPISVDGQTLIYSMMFNYLVATKGVGTLELIQVVGSENQIWKQAFNAYLSKYNTVYNPHNMAILLEHSEIEERVHMVEKDYEKEVNQNNEEANEVQENEQAWTEVCYKYDEVRDISMSDIIEFDSMSNQNQQQKEVSLSRLVRNTKLSDDIKLAYNDNCQLCETRLMKSKLIGYSEAHHIRPYNRIHQGDDTIANLIVLCPNCHTQFDSLYYAIHPETQYVHCQDELDKYHMKKLHFIEGHELDERYLTYTWKLFNKNRF